MWTIEFKRPRVYGCAGAEKIRFTEARDDLGRIESFPRPVIQLRQALVGLGPQAEAVRNHGRERARPLEWARDDACRDERMRAEIIGGAFGLGEALRRQRQVRSRPDPDGAFMSFEGVAVASEDQHRAPPDPRVS